MLLPTSKTILVSSQENDNSFKTIKIDFSQMSSIKSTKNKYTQCQNCKSILTIEDKSIIDMTNIFQSNQIQWICRFCKNYNKSRQLYFVSSNFKHCLQQNLPSKVVPPIILFLIDISGSMTASLLTDLKNTNKQKKPKSRISSYFKNIISKSIFRKYQLQNLNEFQKSYSSKIQTDDNFAYMSKLSFLFSIIQHHLQEINQKQIKTQYRIGFILFSDSLVVLKGSKQKSIPMYVDQSDDSTEIYPFKKQKLDFNNHFTLFEKGKSYQRYFADSKLNNFDISKLAIQHIKTGGKTALGPALLLALGMISQHDLGSKIILVTDSNPNYGFLSSKNDKSHYKQFSNVLAKNKATLGVLRLINNEFQNTYQDIEFQNFLNSNKQHIKKIQISILPSITQILFQNAVKSLHNLINHNPVGQSYKLFIHNDNKHITLDKFKYDQLDFRNLRFITSQSKCWIQIQIDQNKIKQEDLLFPVMTQLVIQYHDIFTKQKCLFMSYIQQKLTKPYKTSKIYQRNQQIIQQSLQDVNHDNLQNIIDMQNMKKFQIFKQSESFKYRTYRQQLKDVVIKINNVNYKSIECVNINDYAMLQNKIVENQKFNQYHVQNTKNQNQDQDQLQYETI